MNIKRILAVMAVFSLLTGVACADDIMEIVLTESLDDYLNESELVLNDLDIQGAMECQVDGDMEGDLSREADNVGYANQNRQKTITVKKNTSKTVYLGTRYQIVVPNNTIASCKSSSRKVAKVSKTGLITPKKAGQATITIQTKKKTLTLALTVVDPTVPTKVVILEGKQGTVYVGQELGLTARVYPASASQSVKWKSSRKSVAKVSAKGVVTGVKPGKAKITATAGMVQATYTVTVKKAFITPAPTSTPEPTPTPESTPTPTSQPTPTPTPDPTSTPTPTPTERISEGTIKLSIGGNVFTSKLEDNATARAFVGLLPMTLDMSELNGNEKYCYLDGSLPSAPERVEQIHAGDLMLYGNNCIVLFYKSFSTQYSYTRIGHIDDISGLETAVGRGSVQVKYTE